MQDQLNLKRERPIRALRRRLLQALLKDYGGPKGLARLVDTVDNHLTTIDKGRRDVGDELATKIEEKLGKPFGWMDGALSDEVLEIAMQLESITDPELREVAIAKAYTAAFRLQRPARAPDAVSAAPSDRRSTRP